MTDRSVTPAEEAADRSVTLRDRLAERTRELIIEAMAASLGETGPFEFSIFEIARRAGVSPRTIYRHFPTREDMFEALTELVESRLGFAGSFPGDADAVVEALPKLFDAFDANEELMLAQRQTEFGRAAREHGRKSRGMRLQKVIDELAPARPEAEREAMAAACHCLGSIEAWYWLRADLGSDPRRSNGAAAWALRALLDAVADPDRPGPSGSEGEESD
jgi:TetR/AcrR family transcriptional regulator of autoinduction and epiphytic fitness